jgi:hypothetical protein
LKDESLYSQGMEKQLLPVFAGGTGRSGTTIIVNLLSRHPQFHASLPREIKYLTERKGLIDFNFNRPLSEERSLKELRNAIAGKILPLLGKSNFDIFSSRIHGRWWSEAGKKGNQRGLIQSITLDVIDSALIKFENSFKKDPKKASREFFFTLSAAQISSPDVVYFGDSTPTNIINAKYITQIFPEAKFINMIRDGRDVALSVSKERWGPSTPEQALLWWEKRVEYAHNSLEQISSELKVNLRLEDLVVHQREESYQRLLTFLELEEHPTMRKYFNEQMTVEKMHFGEWKNEVKNPEKFGSDYQKVLKRLARKDIFIEKFY